MATSVCGLGVGSQSYTLISSISGEDTPYMSPLLLPEAKVWSLECSCCTRGGGGLQEGESLTPERGGRSSGAKHQDCGLRGHEGSQRLDGPYSRAVGPPRRPRLFTSAPGEASCPQACPGLSRALVQHAVHEAAWRLLQGGVLSMCCLQGIVAGCFAGRYSCMPVLEGCALASADQCVSEVTHCHLGLSQKIVGL